MHFPLAFALYVLQTLFSEPHMESSGEIVTESYAASLCHNKTEF